MWSKQTKKRRAVILGDQGHPRQVWSQERTAQSDLVSPKKVLSQQVDDPNSVPPYFDFYSFSFFLGNKVGRMYNEANAGWPTPPPRACQRVSVSISSLCAYSVSFNNAPCFLHAFYGYQWRMTGYVTFRMGELEWNSNGNILRGEKHR